MAVSPGDQLLHQEKKMAKGEKDDGDQVDAAHADRKNLILDTELKFRVVSSSFIIAVIFFFVVVVVVSNSSQMKALG